MVASGNWTDPKDGVAYPYKGRLKSSELNSYLDGLRAIDKSTMVVALSTFPHRLAPLSTNRYLDAVIDSLTGTLVAVGGDPSTNAVCDYTGDMHTLTAGSITLVGMLLSVATDGAGTVIAGASIAGTSTNLVYRSVNDGATWSARTLPQAVAEVVCVEWNGAMFIAASSVGSNAYIDTSSNGLSWTSRANPLSNTTWNGRNRGGVISNAAGATVLIPGDAASSQFAYSADGITWSAVTAASSTWVGGAWTDEFGWVAFSGDGSAIYTSSSGATWSSGTPAKTVPNLCTDVRSVGAIGNVIVMLWSNGSDTFLSYSLDGAATWSDPVMRIVGQIISSMRTTGGRVIVMDGSGTEYMYISARTPAGG